MSYYSFAGIALALVAAVPAVAAEPQDSTAAVVQRHQEAYAKKDVAALLADYGDDVVIVFSKNVLPGKPAVRAMFERVFASPVGATPIDVKIDRIEGDIGYTKWVMNPGTPKAVEGYDVFVVRGGKIRFQTTYNVHRVEAAAAK